MTEVARVQSEVHSGVVVGYGSIGRRHAQLLAGMVRVLVLVDAQESARSRGESAFPTARVASSLDSVYDEMDWASSVAVIATWGPSHAEIFHALADRGVRRILCEKPMAHSVTLAAGMVERAERDGITLGVNHYVRYMRVAPALARFAAAHGLGEPESLVVAGGAACLLTNGLHWIDFATELFGAEPCSVVSTASGDPINPRSSDLRLYGGTAVFEFSGGREAVLCFSNQSSVAPDVCMYFRDAVVETDGSFACIRIRRRDPGAVARSPAINSDRSRLGASLRRAASGDHPIPRLDGERPRRGGAWWPRDLPGNPGRCRRRLCIGLLLAAREGRTVELPLDPTSPEGRERWLIS